MGYGFREVFSKVGFEKLEIFALGRDFYSVGFGRNQNAFAHAQSHGVSPVIGQRCVSTECHVNHTAVGSGIVGIVRFCQLVYFGFEHVAVNKFHR